MNIFVVMDQKMFVCISEDPAFIITLKDFLSKKSDRDFSFKSVPSIAGLSSISSNDTTHYSNGQGIFILIDLTGSIKTQLINLPDLEGRFHNSVIGLLAENKEIEEIREKLPVPERFIFIPKEDFPSVIEQTISLLKVIFRNFDLIKRSDKNEAPEKPDKKKSEAIISGLLETIQVKDKFISLISHDLKDPLLSLTGISDILLADWQDMDEDEKLVIIKEIRESSHKTYQLIDNLSAWSKKTAAKIEASPQVLPINDILVPSIEIAGLLANQKKINIINEVDEGILVRADRNMISTVLRNLLLNAVRYTPSGGYIRVSVERKEDSYQFCVSDNGIGIGNPALIEHFRPKPNNSPKNGSNGNGQGIGLLFCKEFVEKSGGHIWFETQQGYGTRFYFTLPY